MKNVSPEYIELITKKLTGEASPFELQLLEEWIQEDVENQTAYEQFSKVWKSAYTVQDDFEPDVTAAWNKVKSQTVEAEGSAKVLSITDYQWYLRIAATLLIFIGAGIFGWYWITGSNNMTEIAALDEKKQVILPDSSKVWLNKNSKIKFAEGFEGDERIVYLEGEGFFDVKKSEGRKFQVKTSKSVTTVLGTSFNVKAYKEDSLEEVQVVTGKVSFAPAKGSVSQEVILLPGDKGMLVNNAEVVKTKIENSNFNAWKNEVLQFENTDITQVTAAIEDYFGVKIIIADSLILPCRFTGTFEKPDLEELLEVLTITADINYHKRDNTYVLTGKGCN
ncbi:MAG TPA: FecR domain-containing protein [Cytophagaceae bacterium]